MARSKWISFGAQQQLERAAKAAATPAALPLPSSADAKKFGLENFGNTCYANSVLQALYFCTPFRVLLLQDVIEPPVPDGSPANEPIPKSSAPLVPLRRKPERKLSTPGNVNETVASTSTQTSPHPIPSNPATLFSALQSLFLNISTNPGDKGTVAPRAFIDKLKELNDVFRSTMHQDAHEFLNYLLNRIVEEIEEEKKQLQNGANGDDLSNSVVTLGSKAPPTVVTANSSNSGTHPADATLVHKLFEGVLTSETRCLTCETVSSRDESFLDLSIDIEQNSSVTACLRQFSASEMLCQKNKFFCDSCCDLQEAEKRMKIKKLPNVLALHLKRFKYQEDVAKYIKLAYRVAFPFELRLFNTVDDIDDADRLYNLFAIVVHIGNGPHHGHYISIIKTAGTWLVFDDDNVYPIPESDISKYFGDSNSGSAYVLYYQAADIDLVSLGLRPPEPASIPTDVFLNSVLPTPGSSSLHYQQQPILPPGLNITSPEKELDNTLSHIPVEPAIPQLPSSNDPVLPVVSVPPVPPSDISSQPSNPAPAAGSPVTLGNKFFSSLRRPPSVTASRGGTLAGANNSLGHTHDGQRHTTDRSPRPSTSTPSFSTTIDSSTLETPPPLPPLPPSIFSNSVNTPPISIPQTNEAEKVEKEKEKSKSPGNWFKKRKSLKATAKADSSLSRDAPPSPVPQAEDLSHTSRFKPPSSTPATSKPQRIPSENGVPIPHENKGPNRVNGFDQNHLPGSASSSPGTNSFLNHPPIYAGGSGTRPSTSSTTSGTHLEFPPARKSSLVPISADWSQVTGEHKFEGDPSVPRPASASSAQHSFSSSANRYADLPPLPATPKHRGSHRSQASNGNVYMSESDSYLKGKGRSTEHEVSDPRPGNIPRSGTQLSAPPLSLSSSMGANNSTGSGNSTSSNLRRATRKLSLTAPMLGFGRRDKEKDKDREKDRFREREKDRTSPSAFIRS